MSGRAVLALLRSFANHCGQTVVPATHDPAVASHADRVVFLMNGRVAGQLGDPTPQQITREMTRSESQGSG
ncbi:hypothetical protein ACFXDJ_15405 [Streptomyces sp. NPDC059443]|uniref:hypothetical protein n=1 Tax=unclassified Streptomyces TaxID=2593676 RepID=UPI0036CA2086